jgi:hypothetical protein
MSRHYNTEHPERSRSNYRSRPGVYSGGRKRREMASLESLRAKQVRRVAATCTSTEDHTHDVLEPLCNGSPVNLYDSEPTE